jgi:hypothetical protein
VDETGEPPWEVGDTRTRCQDLCIARRVRRAESEISLREFRLKKHGPQLHINFGPLCYFAE